MYEVKRRPRQGVPMSSEKLTDVAPALAGRLSGKTSPVVRYSASDITHETAWVAMRDGVRLATDLYRPPGAPAPTIAMRTPYDRTKFREGFDRLAQWGYVVIAQDCRGTGDSEPDTWEYYVYEEEDSLAFVDWVTEQDWFDGFLGACGGSYVAQTQFCMGMHEAMSGIAPEVGGLGTVATMRPRHYMYVNSYSRSVGKGADKVALDHPELERLMLDETLAGGYFNDPVHTPLTQALLERYPELRTLDAEDRQRYLWERYTPMSGRERADLINMAVGTSSVTSVAVEALYGVFGHQMHHDATMLPDPQRAAHLHAPALLITGWYDWGLDDTLETWRLLTTEARENVRRNSRLLIAPSAHASPGYHEGSDRCPDLQRSYRSPEIFPVLHSWYDALRDGSLSSWPAVVYYLMGANEWRASTAWPPEEAQSLVLHLGSGRVLSPAPVGEPAEPDRYTYDPHDPPPTLGGNILSNVYTAGSVDVSDSSGGRTCCRTLPNRSTTMSMSSGRYD